MRGDQPIQPALVPQRHHHPQQGDGHHPPPDKPPPGRPRPHPQARQPQPDQPNEPHILAKQHIAVIGQQGVEGQPSRQRILLIKARGRPPPLALQHQSRQQLPGEQQPQTHHRPTQPQPRRQRPPRPRPRGGSHRPGQPVAGQGEQGVHPLLGMPTQQLQAGRDPGEDHIAQPAPRQGQVPKGQHQRHPGNHLQLVQQDDVLQGHRPKPKHQPGQDRPGPSRAQGDPAEEPHAQPGQGDVARHHHLQRHRGRRQHPERQVARVQHPMLEIGQERLPAILVVQPGRQEPTTQQLGQPMLLRPKEPQQHIVEEGLAAGPDRLQERHGEQPQREVDDQPLQQQRPPRRAGSLGWPVLGGGGRVGGERWRPLGDVALHGDSSTALG
jgi:hypothetical protein